MWMTTAYSGFFGQLAANKMYFSQVRCAQLDTDTTYMYWVIILPAGFVFVQYPLGPRTDPETCIIICLLIYVHKYMYTLPAFLSPFNCTRRNRTHVHV
jgi:hypothetical protein